MMKRDCVNGMVSFSILLKLIVKNAQIIWDNS